MWKPKDKKLKHYADKNILYCKYLQKIKTIADQPIEYEKAILEVLFCLPSLVNPLSKNGN